MDHVALRHRMKLTLINDRICLSENHFIQKVSCE